MVSSNHDPLEGVSAKGTIVTGAHKSRIVVEFIPLLKEITQQLISSDQTCSLYLYGSVATGKAKIGFSDVDLLSIGLDLDKAHELAKEFSSKYDKLCRSVEIATAQPANYSGTDDESYGFRVFLRHYCVHILGPDIAADLPDFAADRNAARGFNGDIGIFLARWKDELSHNDELTSLARRIARKTLLAVSGLVSINDHTWTTDRVKAAKRWGEIVPELKAQLETLLEWSNMTPSKISREQVMYTLDSGVSKVVENFIERIGLWSHSNQ